MAVCAPAQTSTTPTLVQVSVGFDKTTFGLLSDRTILYLQNDEWKKIDGQLVQISVGAYHNVWGVNQYQNLFRLTENTWVSLPGNYSYVAASGDNAAVALDLTGNASMWDPDKQSLNPLPIVSGGFTKVAIGRKDRIYALNSAGQLFKYMDAYQSWRPLQKGRYKDIMVTFDGIVSVRDYQNIPYSRTDNSVDLEIKTGQTIANQDFQPNTALTPSLNSTQVPPVTPVSASGSYSILNNRLVGFDSINGTITVETVDQSQQPVLTVSMGAPEDAIIISAHGCVSLSGQLSLPSNNTLGTQPKPKTIIMPTSNCITTKFSRAAPSSQSGTLLGQLPLSQLWKTTQDANASATVAMAQQTSPLADCAADGITYNTHSDETWVRYTLPARPAGSQVHVVAGAQNKYVFPKCNRVYWDNLTFTCKNGNWKLTEGRFGADGACTGWAGPSEFYQVGNKGDNGVTW